MSDKMKDLARRVAVDVEEHRKRRAVWVEEELAGASKEECEMYRRYLLDELCKPRNPASE